jgi:hypothetical protein
LSRVTKFERFEALKMTWYWSNGNPWPFKSPFGSLDSSHSLCS